eukprot:GHVR01156686.1.p1 GENE.GHVR01156686.1~~GHVR01156686.1.p1  ORF type:complete len:265 (+),score=97.62 GHVR01156686.1:285-1079(+)
MMKQTNRYPVVVKDGYSIVCIPYTTNKKEKTNKTNNKESENNSSNNNNNNNDDNDDDDIFTLAALLPTSRDIHDTDGLLNIYKTVKDINCDTDSSDMKVDITFPKTDLTSELNLQQFLTQAGLSGYYSAGSLDNISKGAYLKEAKQQVVVKFDYEGTEAAAVTSASFTKSVKPQNNLILAFNRPFIFSINTPKSNTKKNNNNENKNKKSVALFKGIVFDVKEDNENGRDTNNQDNINNDDDNNDSEDHDGSKKKKKVVIEDVVD